VSKDKDEMRIKWRIKNVRNENEIKLWKMERFFEARG
jgi:hypothetical protein